jgi:tetraacyldisaccharide 4'-kinase
MRAPDFWQTKGPLALLLAPLGLLYGMSVARKARAARGYRSTAKVICVGNLTAGGSGKTPVALALGEILVARGRQVFFLTRGYGGSEPGPLRVTDQTADQVGDEALLLARIAPTIVARDREQGARLAEHQGAEAIVMDDGHQNFSLAKDLSLVVVDGESGFGNGLMIPAGPLRESVAQGLSRADAVVVMGPGQPDLQGFKGLLLRAHLQADGAGFSGRRVFAFAGIGRPQKFLQSLQQSGADVTGWQFFADHHPFAASDMAGLRRQAGDAELVTTEKDFARLAPSRRQGITVLKVRAAFDAPDLLDRLLATV